MPLWICEIVISLAMIVLGVVFYVIAGDFRASFNINDIGAGAFPRLVIVLMCVLAIMQIVISIKNRKTNEKLDIENWATLLSGIALLSVYIILIPIFGYYVTTPFALIGIMVLQGNRNWLQIGLVSAGFCLFVFVVFSTMLRVMLP